MFDPYINGYDPFRIVFGWSSQNFVKSIGHFVFNLLFFRCFLFWGFLSFPHSVANSFFTLFKLFKLFKLCLNSVRLSFFSEFSSLVLNSLRFLPSQLYPLYPPFSFLICLVLSSLLLTFLFSFLFLLYISIFMSSLCSPYSHFSSPSSSPSYFPVLTHIPLLTIPIFISHLSPSSSKPQFPCPLFFCSPRSSLSLFLSPPSSPSCFPCPQSCPSAHPAHPSHSFLTLPSLLIPPSWCFYLKLHLVH